MVIDRKEVHRRDRLTEDKGRDIPSFYDDDHFNEQTNSFLQSIKSFDSVNM